MNTILKTLGDLLETMVRGANTKEFEEYDGSFEKLKTDKNSAEFNRNVSGRDEVTPKEDTYAHQP